MEPKSKSGVWRRWYTWAILATLVISGAVGALVLNLPGLQPTYTSSGTILIRPALEPLIYATEFNTRRPDYDLFMESQVNLLRDQRTIIHAMDLTRDQLRKMDGEDRDRSQRSNNWADKTWPEIASRWRTNDPTEQVLRLTQGLGVFHAGGTQFLVVTFSDQDPILAAAAVKLIIASYRDLYDVDVENFNNRLARLGEKERILTSAVSDMKIFIQGLVGKYGSPEFLTQSLAQKQTDLLQMDDLYGNTEIQVKSMALSALRRAQDLFDAGRYSEADAALRPVLSIWAELWPEDDPRHNDAKKLNARISEKLPSGAAVLPGASSTPSSVEQGTDSGKITLADANDRLKILGDRRDNLGAAVARMRDLSKLVQVKVVSLQRSQQELDDVQSARSKLQFEGVAGGRTQVINPGDNPLHPDHDRRLSAAAASSSVTAGLGLAFIGIIGFIKRLRNRRARILAGSPAASAATTSAEP